jgi:hypothetical protein
MTQLSDDEFTVLSIAAEGESMMPLGRWEQPVEHLVELGFLEQHDKFNNTITSAGKIALREHKDDVDTAMGVALIKANNLRVAYREYGDGLAGKLAEMAKKVAEATGEEPVTALQKCVAAVRDRAVELLG